MNARDAEALLAAAVPQRPGVWADTITATRPSAFGGTIYVAAADRLIPIRS